MQYAHKHDPRNPNDAELLNVLKSINIHLFAIVKELSNQNQTLRSIASTLPDISYSMARGITDFQRWLPKP